MALNKVVCFDCRISQLPNKEEVVNYFRWRADDAFRNALNGHCYWYYRGLGLTDRQAHEKLMGVSNSQKNEILFNEAGVNFNDLPLWHKRGFSLYWKDVERGVSIQKMAKLLSRINQRSF